MSIRFRTFAQSLSLALPLALASLLITGHSYAETLELTFEADEYGELPPTGEATNLYTDRGISFPTRPQIVDDYTARPIRETIMVDGEESVVSRQPLALGVRGPDRCGPLRMRFNPTSDVRRVTMREVTRGTNSVGYEVFDENGTRINGSIIPGSRTPGPLSRDRIIEARSPEGSLGITEILVQPAGNCTEYLVIGDMTIISTAPLEAVEAIPDPRFVTVYRATEAAPEVRWAGRTNDVSIDPSNSWRVVVATDTGGLFNSIDGGVKWRAVTSLPAFDLNAVHHHLANPEIIIVAARGDWARRSVSMPSGTGSIVATNGGIWISRDRGRTWEQPIDAMPGRFNLGATGCSGGGDAWEIDEDAATGRVFIATDCGITFVDGLSDPATTTWTHLSPSIQTGDSRLQGFRSLAHLGGSNVVTGGTSGLWTSQDNGENWNSVNTQPAIARLLIGERHAIAGLPSRPGVGIASFNIAAIPAQSATPTQPAITGVPAQFVIGLTRDGGSTWRNITSIPIGGPRGGGCGGFGFAYATDPDPSGTIAKIFYGDRCTTFVADLNLSRGSLVAPGAEIAAEQFSPQAHADHRSVGFPRRADGAFESDIQFLTGDGGVFRRTGGSADAPRLTAIGSGPDGINALQVYEINGQYVRNTDSFNLAFGTQDNKLWSSSDERNWPISQSAAAEGLRIDMSSEIDRQGNDTWSFLAGSGSDARLSDPLMLNSRSWVETTPPGQSRSYFAPLKINLNADDGLYAQTFRLNRPNGPSRYFLTRSRGYGTTVTSVVDTTSSSGSVRWVRRAGGLSLMGPLKNGTFNVILNGRQQSFDRLHLRFYPRTLSDFSDPTMTNFGSVSMKVFPFDVSAVFAINPSDPMDMIAPDVENNRMMRSNDGGADWTEMTELTSLVTGDGAYSFRRGGSFLMSNVATISYFPQNPELILVGLHHGGALITSDDGNTWVKVDGSEKIPNITSFYWKNANDIWASSYGRGLWRIRKTAERRDLNALTASLSQGNNNALFGSVQAPENGLNLRPFGGSDRSPRSFQAGVKEFGIDEVILVVDGRIKALTPKEGVPLNEWLKTTARASTYEFRNTAVNHDPAKAALAIKPGQLNIPDSDINIRDRLNGVKLSDRIRKSMYQELEKMLSGKATIVGIARRSGQLVAVVEGEPLTHIVPQKIPDGKRTYKPGRVYPLSATFMIEGNIEGIDLGPSIVDPTRPVKLVGENFTSGASVLISQNDIRIGKVAVDDNGGFFAEVALPQLRPGNHEISVTAISPGGKQETVIRGFYAKHFDGEETGK